MKTIAIAACCFALAPSGCAAVASCAATVAARIEVRGEEFSLADLLGPDACRELRRSSAQSRLGAAPLAGSARVLEGVQVRAWLEKAARETSLPGPLLLAVPERVTVRRAGVRSGCADISARLVSPALRATAASAENDCGAAGRILRQAPIEVAGKLWDPAWRRWTLVARCTHPGDCVPFLVRLPEALTASTVPARAVPTPAVPASLVSSALILPAPELRSASGEPGIAPAVSPRLAWPGTPAQTADAAADDKVLVHPGEKTSLLWDQYGIRLVIGVTCLDRGREGETVRARLTGSGRIVRAIVVAEGTLRRQS